MGSMTSRYDEAACARWVDEPPKRAERTPFERDRARAGALGRAAPARREDPGRGAAVRRLRPQPADPHARGRPGRPRPRQDPGLRPRRGRDRRARARPRPPAVRAQRRAGPRRAERRVRGLRGQRADAADPHPAGGQVGRRRGALGRAQPHPGHPRREHEVPLAAHRRRPTRAASTPTAPPARCASSGSTTTTCRCSPGCVPAPSRAGAASRRRSWTSPTTSPTPCTTSRTASSPGGSTCAWLRDAGRRREVWGTVRDWYLPDASDAELDEALDGPVRDGRVAHGAVRREPLRAGRAEEPDQRLIGRLLHAASSTPRTRRSAPVRWRRYAADLVVPRETGLEIGVLKGIAAHYVMRADDRVSVLLDRQREVVAELVDRAAATGRPTCRAALPRRPRGGRLRRGPAAGGGGPGGLADRRLRPRLARPAVLTAACSRAS